MSLQKSIEELLVRVNNLNEALDEQKKRKNKIEELISATKKRSSPERKQKEAGLAAIEEEVNAILQSAARYVTISSALPIRAKEHRVADLRIAQSELSDSRISREERERKAFEIVRNAKAYLKYLEIEKERISEEERAKREEEIKSYRERIELGESRIRSLVQQIQKWISQSGIRIAYQSIADEFETMSTGGSSWGKSVGNAEKLLFGYVGLPINIPEELSESVNKEFGRRYRKEDRVIDYPLGVIPRGQVSFLIEYSSQNENRIKNGIQALVMNLFRYYPLGDYRISILDSVHYNSDIIGGLSACIKSKNSLIERAPENEKGIRATIELLADRYREIEEKIGIETVEEYNDRLKRERNTNPDNAKESIPRRILIINRIEGSSLSRDNEHLAYLLNNSARFGIIPIILEKNMHGGTYGTDNRKRIIKKAPGQVRMISDQKGGFFAETDKEGEARWQRFVWFTAPALSTDYINYIRNAIKDKVVETAYFKRYQMHLLHLPERSHGERRKIELPFAVDQDGVVQSFDFEDDQFATYMMGASGSGKSTLLHTLISGLIMNYHPDEVELWLVDYKMTEFSLYVKKCPPHIKYVLLENSEDLTFDILDKLTELLNQRKYIFAKRGWSKLTDVPQNIYMPAIFVIIDEFSIMSQIIKETKGAVPDYTLKLQNLLAQGRALGMKFLFASQTYSEGVTGLTETARKQIQMRVALKNTPDEIKGTLVLSSDEITPTLGHDILALPKYESLFKYRNVDGELQVGRLKNMYTKTKEVVALIDKLNREMIARPAYNPTEQNCYVDKKPILIDGGTPKTWDESCGLYGENDRRDPDKFPGDLGIYPGVPCSFQLANHFMLCEQFDENILLVGGNTAQQVSALLSILKSFEMSAGNNGEYAEIQILAHSRSRMIRAYHDVIEEKYEVAKDIGSIGRVIAQAKDRIDKEQNSQEIGEKKRQLVVILGYENIINEMERIANKQPDVVEIPQQYAGADVFLAYLEKLKDELDEEAFKKRKAQEMEQKAAYRVRYNQAQTGALLRSARESLEDMFDNASQYGTHFLLCFNTAQDFLKLRLGNRRFRHKLMYAISKDDAYELAGNRRASSIGEDVLMYQGDTHMYTMRPHLHQGVAVNGWSIDERGQAIRRDELIEYGVK